MLIPNQYFYGGIKQLNKQEGSRYAVTLLSFIPGKQLPVKLPSQVIERSIGNDLSSITS